MEHISRRAHREVHHYGPLQNFAIFFLLARHSRVPHKKDKMLQSFGELYNMVHPSVNLPQNIAHLFLCPPLVTCKKMYDFDQNSDSPRPAGYIIESG